jgi:hypothetical protein
MGVRVVESYPGSVSVGRFFGAAFGVVLLVVAMVAAVLPVVFVVGLLVDLIDVGDAPSTDGATVGLLVGSVAVSVVGGWAGLRLLRGRRRLGLFLRRFGYGEATRTISTVVAGGLGRSWRMVTLDDSSVAPIGSARRHRFVSVLVTVAALVAAGFALQWLFGGGLDEATGRTLADAGTPQDLGQAIGNAIGAAVVVALLLALVLLIAAIALVVGGVGGLALRSARLARRQASVVVDRPDQVARQARSIARRNRRVISSRLVVCTVANPLWQDTVRALAATADAVVVDLSHATENVVWEVEQLTPDRWVLVCHRDRLAPLLAAGTAAPGSPYHRLGRLLDGQDVLVYSGGQRRFARSLRHRLDAMR